MAKTLDELYENSIRIKTVIENNLIKAKIGFDANTLISELVTGANDYLRTHPDKALDIFKGKVVDAKCPECGDTRMEIREGGKLRCVGCGYTGNADIQINMSID